MLRKEGYNMVYFDNAATTYPKPDCVYSYTDEFYRNTGGNVGRGDYSGVLSAGMLVKDTRSRIQNLLHCPVKQVIFSPTATIALNIILQGLIAKGVKNIYITPFEHNAVTRILYHFQETIGIQVQQLSVSESLIYDMERIRYQFDSVKPDLVVASHASNVIGLVSPINEICTLAKKYDAITVLDMSQTAGLIDCNIGLDIYDFAVFAGHKTLYGPTGISGFVMKPSVELPAVLFGGTGYESANQNMPESLPEKFEMGTLNIAGIAGLNAALKWIEKTTVAEIRNRENENRKKLLDLLEEYKFIHTVGVHEGREYVGIVSCLIEGISSDSASGIFDQQNIAVRTGLQCAPLAHKFLGTYPSGTIRLSVGYFTDDNHFDQLRAALDYIEDNL